MPLHCFLTMQASVSFLFQSRLHYFLYLLIACTQLSVHIKQQSEQSPIRYSAINMSKSCCFAVVLAVICLPVILLSLETDAQPTVDETTSCGSSTSDEIMNIVKMIASNQQENAKHSEGEFNDVKKLLASHSADCVRVQPSKQALVSALECKHIAYF